MNAKLKLTFALALIFVISIANAQSSGAKTYYDNLGNALGSSRNYGSGTTYFDSLGSPIGRSANYSDAPQVSLLPFTPQPVQNDVEGAVARAYRTAYGDSSPTYYPQLMGVPSLPY